MGKQYQIVIDPAGYTPRGGCAALWEYEGPEAVVAGPSETGKTLACVQKMDALLWQYPGAQGVLVRKQFKALIPSAYQTLTRKVLAPDSDVTPFGGERPEWLSYPNGSRLWLAGLDNPGKALSSERDYICTNQTEEMSLADWEVLTTRVTGRAGNVPVPMLWGDANPGPPHHWIKHRTALRVFESRHEDNPTLYDAAAGTWTEQGRRTLAVLDALTGVRKERLRYGRWVSAEGAVFSFDPARHVVGRDEAVRRGVLSPEGGRGPAAKAAVAGCDWGYTSPGALLAFLLDPDGRLYLVEEHYQTQRLIGWWVQQARQVKARWGVEVFVCDPAQPSHVEEFNLAGLYPVPADNERLPGIQAVEARLAAAGDGLPRLFLVEGALQEADPELVGRRQALCLRDEFDALVWKPVADGRVNREETAGPDHSADVCRYVCMWADRRQRLAGAPPLRGGLARVAQAPKGTFFSGGAMGRW